MRAGGYMQLHERPGAAAERPQAATLYLALFLALLAFFLFLTSISTFDPARAVSVIESVEARFAETADRPVGPERSVPAFAGLSGERIVADAQYLAGIVAAFAAVPGTSEARDETLDLPWHGVRLSADDLFLGSTSALSAEGSLMLDNAAAAMARGESGAGTAQRRIDIAVAGDGDDTVRRAAAIAAVFTRVSGPQPVTMQVVPDATGRADVELVFYAVNIRSGAGGRS